MIPFRNISVPINVYGADRSLVPYVRRAILGLWSSENRPLLRNNTLLMGILNGSKRLGWAGVDYAPCLRRWVRLDTVRGAWNLWGPAATIVIMIPLPK